MITRRNSFLISNLLFSFGIFLVQNGSMISGDIIPSTTDDEELMVINKEIEWVKKSIGHYQKGFQWNPDDNNNNNKPSDHENKSQLLARKSWQLLSIEDIDSMFVLPDPIITSTETSIESMVSDDSHNNKILLETRTSIRNLRGAI